MIDNNIKRPEQMLEEMVGILESLNIDYVLDWGTLLGAVRDGDFIKNDWNDIDITTLHNASIIPQILEKVIEAGFTVKKSGQSWSPEKKASAMIKVMKNGVGVDVFFMRVKGEYAWISRGDKKKTYYRRIKKSYYEDTDTILFKGRLYKKPRLVEEYLTDRYGDWRSPIAREDYDYRKEPSMVESFEDL